MTLLRRFLTLFRSSTPVPADLRSGFMHLYFDVAWFGIVSGTTIAFQGVYATRQGASAFQIGLLSAAPALINLIFALPAGSWLGKRPLGSATFWTSIATRIFYAVMVVLPSLLAPEAQVWTIILITLLMTIPATALVVGFNSIFAEVVPVDWRGQVVGVRNAILALVTVVFTLISGQILEAMPFPLGYQVVFALGFLGVAMSSLHIYFLGRIVARKAASRAALPVTVVEGAVEASMPANGETPRRLESQRLEREIRTLYQNLYRRGLQTLRLDVMRGPFSRLMGLLFFWHTMQFLSIPLFTPFIVNELGMTDPQISLANSLFNVTVFLGSLRLSRATRRYGNKTLTGMGIVGLSVFPLLTSFARGWELYALANLIGGLAWAMAGGALYNFILERSPDHDRPAHLAWYNLVSNAAILVGSLTGPAIAPLIGFPAALFLFGIGRLLAGLAILKWG